MRRSTTRWSVWRRIFPCATCSLTGTATSAPSTETLPRRIDTPRRACRSSATRCCATSIRTPSTGTRTSTSQEKSRVCCRPVFRTCWSTARRELLSAWRRIFRRTICARSSTPVSACWITPRQICSTSWTTSRVRISRRTASSWGAAASAPPTPPAAAKLPSARARSSKSSGRTGSASSLPSFPIRSTSASSLPRWQIRCATSASRASPISATRQTATVCASSLSSKRTPTRR